MSSSSFVTRDRSAGAVAPPSMPHVPPAALPGVRRSSVSRCVRAPLAAWLERVAASLPAVSTVLDVGCGDRRHERFFSAGRTYVGFDAPWNSAADITGDATAIPVDDATFDAVLCTQVLEHLPDPAAAVRELRRVVRPGGLVVASTHGVAAYHPSPLDLWRWTQPGLERLFLDNADWASLAVAPAQGTAATASMLLAHLVDLGFKRLHIRFAGRPLVFALNVCGEAVDRLFPLLRQPIPGSLTATFHVEARAS